MTTSIKNLVAARRTGMVGDAMVEAVLGERIARFADDPTPLHSVRWNSNGWLSARRDGKSAWTDATASAIEEVAGPLPPATGRDGWQWISRSDVIANRDHPLRLFIAAMAWGYGSTGYGWSRTSAVLNKAGADRVASSVVALGRIGAEGDNEAVWRAWSRGGAAKLAGVATAFASKVAYFAAYDHDTGRGPLIADRNTTWALWALDGRWDSRTSPADYAEYVEWAERWAQRIGCRSDDIERALFVIGPKVIAADKN